MQLKLKGSVNQHSPLPSPAILTKSRALFRPLPCYILEGLPACNFTVTRNKKQRPHTPQAYALPGPCQKADIKQ
eukprot:630244-Hanusia_phi.AAC.1